MKIPAKALRRSTRSETRETIELAVIGRLCALQDAAGRVEACPGARCPFWEPGGAVLAGGCLIERLALDLERRPDLSHYLLELRLTLDEGRADPPGTRQLFYRLSRESSPVA